MPILLPLIELSYGISGKKFGILDENDFPYIYVGVLGIAITLVAVLLAASASRKERRTQDTLKFLIEIRYSSKEFQEQALILAGAFPPGQVVSLKQFLQYNTSDDPEEKTKAVAVIRVLNYYEFICFGIQTGNLDEYIVKETVRSILCSLVYDMQNIICHYRRDGQSKKNFEHIIAVFLKWAKDDPLYAESYDELKKKFLG